jgi:hypothetical protein
MISMDNDEDLIIEKHELTLESRLAPRRSTLNLVLLTLGLGGQVTLFKQRTHVS